MSEMRAPQQPGHSANYQPPVSPSSAAASGVPSYAAVIPLIFAGVGLLLLFLVLVWVLFGPQDFTERLIAFGVAAALMVWMTSVLDSAQRRSFERLRAKMELQRELAVAEALAEERNRLLDQFMGTFVVKVHGTAGDFIPYPTPMAFNLTSPGGNVTNPGGEPSQRTIDLSDRHDDQSSAAGWGR